MKTDLLSKAGRKPNENQPIFKLFVRRKVIFGYGDEIEIYA